MNLCLSSFLVSDTLSPKGFSLESVFLYPAPWLMRCKGWQGSEWLATYGLTAGQRSMRVSSLRSSILSSLSKGIICILKGLILKILTKPCQMNEFADPLTVFLEQLPLKVYSLY